MNQYRDRFGATESDACPVGLTITPANRTYRYFRMDVDSGYRYEQVAADTPVQATKPA